MLSKINTMAVLQEKHVHWENIGLIFWCSKKIRSVITFLLIVNVGEAGCIEPEGLCFHIMVQGILLLMSAKTVVRTTLIPLNGRKWTPQFRSNWKKKGTKKSTHGAVLLPFLSPITALSVGSQ